MKQLLACALQELEAGRRAALAVIVASTGSTPRTTGAAMVVGEAGLLAGTIGGGELEYKCIQMALEPEKPLAEFYLDHRQAACLGMACGGSAQVLFVQLRDPELLRSALAQIQALEPGQLLLPLDGGIPSLTREPGLRPQVAAGRLCLPLQEPGRIFLMGGGHVSLELARILDILGYPYIVIDDRPEFSGTDRFPGALATLTADFTRLSQVLTGNLAPGALDCLCVLTRGHLSDMDALRFGMSTPAGYIGLMGSRKKRERAFAMLESDGFPDAPERITTPIGLPIGGQTPAEVAISIAAQLVQHRNRPHA